MVDALKNLLPVIFCNYDPHEMRRNPGFPKRVLSSCCNSELYNCCAMAVTNLFWHRGRKQIQTGWMHTVHLVSALLWGSQISQYFLHRTSVLAIAFRSEQHLMVICYILSSFFWMLWAWIGSGMNCPEWNTHVLLLKVLWFRCSSWLYPLFSVQWRAETQKCISVEIHYMTSAAYIAHCKLT